MEKSFLASLLRFEFRPYPFSHKKVPYRLLFFLWWTMYSIFQCKLHSFDNIRMPSLSLKALNRPMKWNERQPAAVKRLAFPALLQHWGYCMREGKKKQEVEQWFFFLSSFLEWAKCLGTSRSLNLVGKKFKRESKIDKQTEIGVH